MQLTLSADQQEIVRDILEQHHRELLREIARTHHHQFRELLRKKEEQIESLLCQFSKQDREGPSQKAA